MQPANFIGNKVAGILFENKVHHTTYFSDDIECIQGIHMIPVHAPTGFSRSDALIRQEWNAFFSNGRIDRIDNGWKSIIYANSALVAPRRAWDYFRANSFKQNWLDGGASRTWYMAYTAGKPRDKEASERASDDGCANMKSRSWGNLRRQAREGYGWV